jgi:hypothetical protein
MLEFVHPIPVVTPFGEGYAIYATNSGAFENDIWTVSLCEGGRIMHFRTDQLKSHVSGTLGIIKKDN